MDTILQNRAIVNLPAAELEDELSAFLEPVLLHLPEKRLREVEVGCERGHWWTIAACDPDGTRSEAGGNSHLAHGQAAVSQNTRFPE